MTMSIEVLEKIIKEERYDISKKLPYGAVVRISDVSSYDISEINKAIKSLRSKKHIHLVNKTEKNEQKPLLSVSVKRPPDVEHQLIYDIMDKQFESFIKNNHELLEEISYNGIIDVLEEYGSSRLHSIDMLKFPYNVAYIGVCEYKEGNLIAFLDKEFNKVYHYYDVE